MSELKEIVAVYGTLRPGFSNNKYTGLRTQEYLGIDKTTPNYSIEDWGGFPGMFKDGKTSVTVSLYEVTNPEVWKALDRLEGHRDGVKSGFHRERITLESGTEAWTYIYYGNEHPENRLEHGDWKYAKIGEYNPADEVSLFNKKEVTNEE